VSIDPDVTCRTSGSRPKKVCSPPSERGSHAYSIPQAGRMVGLSRGASYAAAKRGEIPTIPFGDRLVVPKAPWHRKLGLEN
jgi:hypothetical protein